MKGILVQTDENSQMKKKTVKPCPETQTRGKPAGSSYTITCLLAGLRKH